MAKEKPETKQTRVRNNDLRVRIEQVKEQLLTGVSRPLLLDLCQTEWGISEPQAYKYIQQAEAEILEVVHANREQWLAEHIAIRRSIRKRANDRSDLAMELAAAKDEARLLGLDPSLKIDAKVTTRTEEGLSDAELAEQIRLLDERLTLSQKRAEPPTGEA